MWMRCKNPKWPGASRWAQDGEADADASWTAVSASSPAWEAARGQGCSRPDPLAQLVFSLRTSCASSLQCAVAGFALAISAASVPAAPNLSARLDRETISLGESVTLSLVFEDVAPQNAPSLPSIPNVRVSPNVSGSRNYSFDNGVSSSSVTFSFELVPTQAGEITIPKIAVRIGGQTLATEPLKLTVLKSGASVPPTADAAVFLKLMVAKNQMYVGELVRFELQLYVEEGDNPQMAQIPGEGFTLGRFSQAPTIRTRINNRLYHVLTLKSFFVPAKTGPLALGPATMSLNVPDRARRSNFFFQSTRPVTVASEAQSLQVLPLPTENVPPGFSGAVGDYTLAVTASPTDVAVGDPITVRIQIRGSGLLDALNLPPQPDWREFKSYPPSSKVEPTDPLGSSGVKSFEQVVVPQNSEIKSLPPLVFSFFDPGQKQYRTVSSSPVALTVRPAGASPSVPTNFANASEASAPPPPQDIVHIKPHLGELAAVSVPLVQQRWFLALQAVPVLLWLSLLARRKYADRLAANPRLRRQREVARTVRAGLRELRESAAANQADPFFAALFRVLQEQLGERLDLPASAITEAVIDERLRGGELSAETLSTLHELFSACNVARYARHSGQELALLIPKLERALQSLQRLKP